MKTHDFQLNPGQNLPLIQLVFYHFVINPDYNLCRDHIQHHTEYYDRHITILEVIKAVYKLSQATPGVQWPLLQVYSGFQIWYSRCTVTSLENIFDTTIALNIKRVKCCFLHTLSIAYLPLFLKSLFILRTNNIVCNDDFVVKVARFQCLFPINSCFHRTARET